MRNTTTVSLRQYAFDSVRNATKSAFVRGASALILYTVAGQLFTALFSLVLTRLYSPTQFGDYGLMFSFVNIAGVLICLNYNFAIPAPTQEKDAIVLMFASALISVGMSVFLSVTFVVLVLSGQFGYSILPAWTAIPMLFLLIVTGLMSTLQYWCVRKQQLRALGEAVLLQNLARGGVQGLLGLLFPHWIDLVIGEIGGRIAQLARYLRVSLGDWWQLRTEISLRNIVASIVRYQKFATILLIPGFVDAVWRALPIPVLNMLFGLSTIGQFYLMSRVLDLPLAFISRTVADAFYAKISEYARTDPGRIKHMLVLVFTVLAGSSAIILFPFAIFGPTIFGFLFGGRWREAGLYAALMIPGAVLQIGTSPVTRVFALTRRAHLRYAFTLVQVFGGTGMFLFAWQEKMSAIYTIAGLSAVNVVAYSVYIISAYFAASDIELDNADEVRLSGPALP